MHTLPCVGGEKGTGTLPCADMLPVHVHVRHTSLRPPGPAKRSAAPPTARPTRAPLLCAAETMDQDPNDIMADLTIAPPPVVHQLAHNDTPSPPPVARQPGGNGDDAHHIRIATFSGLDEM